MRKLGALLTVALALGAGSALMAADAGNLDRVSMLIRQLGHSNFRQREAATRELDAIGEPALDALRKAAKGPDTEIADRAASLVARIEHRAENARLIAPTCVELSVQDVPVEQAVAELAKKTGFDIVVGGDKSKLSGRRVSLDTGKVPFWKALELLCEKSGLAGGDHLVMPVPGQPEPLPHPMPVQPAQPMLGRGTARPVYHQQIVLADAAAKATPSHCESAIRVRTTTDGLAERKIGPVPQDEFALLLEVRAEPKIQIVQLLGVKIDRVVDEFDQRLTAAMASVNDVAADLDNLAANQPVRQIQFGRVGALEPQTQAQQSRGLVVPARIKKGERETKSIKEIRGTVALKIRTPVEAMVSVEDILKAKGRTVQGKGRSSLQVIDVSKQENGDVRVEVGLQYSSEIQPMRQQGTPGRTGQEAPYHYSQGLGLIDSNGQPFQSVQAPVIRSRLLGGMRSWTLSLVFRPGDNQAEAAALVFMGSRLATVEAPFQLKDVPVK